MSFIGLKLNKGAGSKFKSFLAHLPTLGIAYYFYELIYVRGFEASTCFCEFREFLEDYLGESLAKEDYDCMQSFSGQYHTLVYVKVLFVLLLMVW
mmetsp:Transcript_36894/g.56485  ORF Transcript_36894/g.56485 Transcript_36894/m.56485 type:complete len:95 (+) Transcript_36894:237-521(+)